MRSCFSKPAILVCVLAIAVLTMLVGAFMASLIASFVPFFSSDLQSLELGTSATFSGNTLNVVHIASAVRFTVLQAACSTICAIVVGLPAAFLTARRTFFARRVLASLAGIPIALPPILIALSFVLFYGQNGIVNRILMRVFSLKEAPITFLYSFWGIIITQGLYNFPVIMRITADVWEHLPPDQADAARLLGSSEWRVFRTITIFQLAPALGAGITLVFLYCFFSFVIIMLFGTVGGTIIEIEIFQAIRSDVNFKTAAVFAIIETSIAAVCVTTYAWFQKKISSVTTNLRFPNPRIPLQNVKEKTATIVYLSFLAFSFLGPLVSLVIRSLQSGSSFSYAPYVSLFSKTTFIGALQNTITTGLASATLSTVAAVTFAILIKIIPAKYGTLLKPCALLPLAVSSVVLGLGWISISPASTVSMLIIAQSSVAWVFALRYISTHIDAIPQSLIDADKLLSPCKRSGIFRLYIPLAKRGIITAFCFSFAISAGDATLPLMLSIYKYESLALYIYRLAGSYQFTEACACGVILTLLIALSFFIADRGTKNHSVQHRRTHHD